MNWSWMRYRQWDLDCAWDRIVRVVGEKLGGPGLDLIETWGGSDVGDRTSGVGWTGCISYR